MYWRFLSGESCFEVLSGWNSISFKLSCMSLLPVRMRLIESKMKELECSQDFSHYKSMGIFQDAQGQLTPQSLLWSGQISNSSEMLWISLLSASLKKIRSKMKVLECSQDFPHNNPMGAISCHGNQSSNSISPKTYCSLSPTPMTLLLKFDCDWPTGLRDIHVWKCGHTDTHTDWWTDAGLTGIL